MTGDAVGLVERTEFYWLSKCEGDRARADSPPPLPHDVEELRKLAARLQFELYALRADLTDPRCFEIIAGRDGPQFIWRK